MTNDSRRILAFSLALGSVILGKEVAIHAEETTPVEVTPIVESATTDAVAQDYVTTGDDQSSEDLNPSAKEVEVQTVPNQSTDIITIDANFVDKNENTLKVICDSLTKGNMDSFLEALSDYYDENDTTPIKLINEQFVDSDKFSTYLGYDRNHCWANAAANILWTTGWAINVNNPLTNQPFTSTDEIATYFATYLEDTTATTDGAYEWFFDGDYFSFLSVLSGGSNVQIVDSSTKYNNDDHGSGLEQTGTLNTYSVYSIKHSTILNKLSDINDLDQFGSKYQTEANIYITDGVPENSFGHALTISGVIKDSDGNYKALIIADSDNDIDSTQTKPDTERQALEVKENRTNSYTIYKLGIYTDTQGNQSWELINYCPYSKYHALLTIFNSLDVKDDNSVKLAYENDKSATENTAETMDLVMYLQKTVDSLEQTALDKTTFDVNESVYFTYIYGNAAKVSFANEDGTQMHQKVDIYKDGKLYDSFIYSEQINVPSLLNINSMGGQIIDLTQYMHKKLVPGKYSVNITLNAGNEEENRYPEAYYKNNSFSYDKSQFAYFTILGEEEKQEEKDEQEVTPSIPKEYVLTAEKETVDTSAFTSIQSFVSLLVVSLGGIVTSLKRRH